MSSTEGFSIKAGNVYKTFVEGGYEKHTPLTAQQIEETIRDLTTHAHSQSEQLAFEKRDVLAGSDKTFRDTLNEHNIPAGSLEETKIVTGQESHSSKS